MSLYVEEYVTAEKSQAAFDIRLADEGLLPLLILVQNGGQQEYAVKPTDIVLRGKTGMNVLTAEQAASKAERSAVGRALGWSLTARSLATGDTVTIATPLPAAKFTGTPDSRQKPTGEHRW